MMGNETWMEYAEQSRRPKSKRKEMVSSKEVKGRNLSKPAIPEKVPTR